MRREVERLAAEGDFDGFYSAQYVRLVRALLLLTGDPGEAEDLARSSSVRATRDRLSRWIGCWSALTPWVFFASRATRAGGPSQLQIAPAPEFTSRPWFLAYGAR